MDRREGVCVGGYYIGMYQVLNRVKLRRNLHVSMVKVSSKIMLCMEAEIINTLDTRVFKAHV